MNKKSLIILLTLFNIFASVKILSEDIDFDLYTTEHLELSDAPIWEDSLSIKDSLENAIYYLKKSLHPLILSSDRLTKKQENIIKQSKFGKPVVVRNLHASNQEINKKELFAVFWPYIYEGEEFVGSIRADMIWVEKKSHYEFGGSFLRPVTTDFKDKFLILISESEVEKMVEKVFNIDLTNKPLAVSLILNNKVPELKYWQYYVYIDEGIKVNDIIVHGLLITPFAVVDNLNYTPEDLWYYPVGYRGSGFSNRAYYIEDEGDLNLIDISNKELNGYKILYAESLWPPDLLEGKTYISPLAKKIHKLPIIPVKIKEK